jgi:microcystin-dependent protein
LYWDSNTKSFAVTTFDISTDATKIWLCTVTYTYVGSGPSVHNSLSSLIERRRIGSSTEKYQRWVTTARPSNPVPGEYGFNMDISAPEYYDGVAWQSLGVLTGSTIDFCGATVPTGYLLCDGSAVSRTAYSNLFSVIGVLWGAGDGSTTFNIPNFQRSVAVGSGGTGTAELGNTVGNTGGEETHTLTSTEVPNTSVTVSISDPTHPHNIATTALTGAKTGLGLNDANSHGMGLLQGSPGDGYTTGNHDAQTGHQLIQNAATGITASGTVNGGNGGHNNVQPSCVVTKCIKY